MLGGAAGGFLSDAALTVPGMSMQPSPTTSSAGAGAAAALVEDAALLENPARVEDPALADGAITAEEEPRRSSLSPSRASDFMTCPLLYRFRVIDRLPQRPSSAATRGTVVHSVLERLFDLPAAERTMEHASTMLRPEWDRLREEEPEVGELFADDAARDEWLQGASGLLDAYFALEDPQRLEPAERELYVECDLDTGLRLRGYVDRLDVAPGGELRVVDYKTGRAPGEGFEAKAMFQMRFYALVLWRLRGEIPRVLQLLYLGSGEVLRYTPDEADLLATERKVEAIWDAICRATERGDWRPSPSKLCDWCDHRYIRCTAWPIDPEKVEEDRLWRDSRGAAAAAEIGSTEMPSPFTPVDEV
jgi:putative RecB family exonuclease